MGRKFFVGGTWKCNGRPDDVVKMFSVLKDAVVPPSDVVEVVVGAPLLEVVKKDARGQLSQHCAHFQFASADCWVPNEKNPQIAGRISAQGCVFWGIPWIITGHYDGRVLSNQSNEVIGDKVADAVSTGVKVIACVGETLEQRKAGVTRDVVAAQTKAIADKISDWSNVVIAYQPAWAIGSGESATAEEAQGPVNRTNCEDFAAQSDIDGFHVVGAYLMITSKANLGVPTTQPSVYIQIIQFLVAMFIMDTWQYFVHRYMHQNKFLYRHIHSKHHSLIVPYAIGALYNHPLEGLLLDTVGGVLSFLISGMTARTSVFFFCFAVIKTVDDHYSLWMPGNIFHMLFQNNTTYHDIHRHQLQGLKYNYSQPFFPIWDHILGTHMPYNLVKRDEGGFEARPAKEWKEE